MVIGSASIQKTGMITLPKKWRDRHPTTVVLFEETPDGLLVRPYDDIQYWEDDRGNFGLHFPTGISAGRLATDLEASIKRLDLREKARKKVSVSRKRR